MELQEVFRLIEKNLSDINKELGFKYGNTDDECTTFSGDKGAYKIVFDSESSIMSFDCAYNVDGQTSEFSTISRSLFDLETYNEKDVKSFSNEIADELNSLFNSKKKRDLQKIKMPKAVSKSQAKSGMTSYDVNSLANRFGTLYPELKDKILENIAEYDEFLPETFFTQYGSQRVIDDIRNGNEAQLKKLFKMLNEIYEDGTNEVQDIIGVTILGEMKGDAQLLEVADKYMSDYMSGPVHEINKVTKKNGRLVKKLLNPPPYKPKKKKINPMQSILAQGGQPPQG